MEETRLDESGNPIGILHGDQRNYNAKAAALTDDVASKGPVTTRLSSSHKRRSSGWDRGPDIKKRRHESNINGRYLSMLNEMIDDAIGHSGEGNTHRSKPLRARDLFPSDKAAFEVLEHHQQLKHASDTAYRRGQHHSLLKPTDIPAAAEISKPCCDSLERAGDDVQLMQWDREIEREREKFKQFAILDRDMAAELDELNELNEQGRPQEPAEERSHGVDEELQNASRLIHLDFLLLLSETIFMNTAEFYRPADKFSDNQGYNDDPSIFATALIDFHNLVVNVTRRMVVAAIFQANARLRATDTDRNAVRGLVVKQQDVLTAVDVLGLTRDSVNYWINLPRRFGLEVYEHNSDREVHRSDGNPALTHDMVESRLRNVLGAEPSMEFSSSSLAGSHLSQNTRIEQRAFDYPSQAGASSSPLEDEDSKAPEVQEEHIFDHYMESFDQNSSRKAEKRLWRLLEQSPPSNLDLSETELPKEPEFSLKTRDEMQDWRGRCDYMAKWERDGQISAQNSGDAILLKSRRDVQRRGRSSSRRASSSRSQSSRPEREPSRDEESNYSSKGEEDRLPERRKSNFDLHVMPVRSGSALFAAESTRRSHPRRQARLPVYNYPQGTGKPHVEDLLSDSEDEYN